MSDKWDMDEAYPPILWKDYQGMVRPLVAEWVRCAGLTCDNEYALYLLAEDVRDMVIRLLKNGGSPPPLLTVRRDHFRRED
jgi:hypothetical protein